MFDVGDLWLETRVVIKILTNLATKEPLTNFHGDEAKKKKSKWPTQKKCIFQNRQFLIFFCENFMDWFLGF